MYLIRPFFYSAPDNERQYFVFWQDTQELKRFFEYETGINIDQKLF